MNVEYGQDLKRHSDLSRLAEGATPVLAEEIGPASARVNVTWDYAVDSRGRPLIRLTIQDWSAQETTEFAPDELREPDRIRRRFYRLWGDLLQTASDRLSLSLQADMASEN